MVGMGFAPFCFTSNMQVQLSLCRAVIVSMDKMISIDPFLDRVPGPKYNCLDFTREVWLALTGQDLTAKLTMLVGDFAGRKATPSGMRGFKKLLMPVSPCLVVMQRFKFVPHLGIFLDGRILHLPAHGAEFQPLVVARAYFQRISYYK